MVMGQNKEQCTQGYITQINSPPMDEAKYVSHAKRVQTLKRRIDRQNKPNLSIILKHKKLEKNLQIALTEDQAIYEETVTSSRRFSDLQKYLNKISSSRKYPQKMFYKEKSTRDDTQKATFFNEFFISVYQKESIPNPLARNTNCSLQKKSVHKYTLKKPKSNTFSKIF